MLRKKIFVHERHEKHEKAAELWQFGEMAANKACIITSIFRVFRFSWTIAFHA
jgi:hypothetical protein